MKSLTPWLGLVALASTQVCIAENAVDAYREGAYTKAANDFLNDKKYSSVEHDYLGEMYLYGYGVLKNNRLAIQHLTKAAEKGYLPAQQFMARYELNYKKDPTAALKWFKKAAEQDDRAAQLYCSAAYHFGVGVKKNEDKARYYDIKAAKAGHALAQAKLAEHFLDSRHGSNKKLGLIWLKRSFEQKEPMAQFLMAEVYMNGKYETKDLELAKQLFDESLKGGYVHALEGLSQLAKASGDEAESQKLEAKYKEEMAKLGDTPEASAAHWLSHGKTSSLAECGYVLKGIYTDWTNKTAQEQNRYNQSPKMAGVSRKAIYQPKFDIAHPNEVPLTEYYDVILRASLGQIGNPLDGKGIDLKALEIKEYPLAESKYSKLLEERAALGDPTAQFALGQLFERGKGGAKQDYNKAIEYYMDAIAQQDLKAEYTLGVLHLTGGAGKVDYKQAVGWLSDAAFKGNPDAQYLLGRLYEEGYKNEQGEWGIKPNAERAKGMYSLSAFNKNPAGEYHLAELLVRDKTGSLTVQEKQKRHALMKRLYQDAASKGIKEATLPLAFFEAMESGSEEKQANALSVAKAEAKSGNKKAALLYALLLDRGIGTSPDKGEAIYWYEQVQDSPVSEFVLGSYYALGEGLGEDKPKAKELLAKASEQGFSFADLNLAILEKQEGLPYQDNLDKAHERGNARASLLLADAALEHAESEEGLKEARDIYTKLAERGDRDAQLKLGFLYEKGLGGAKDFQTAKHWYELSAKQGQPEAQFLLGRLYQNGELDKYPDYISAKKWYEQAKDAYAPAAIALGYVYETIDKDYAKAKDAYRIAANKHHPSAAFNLGLVYQYGKGIEMNPKEAETLFLEAEQKGMVEAMVQLGELNYSSDGFRSDHAAFDWYQKAAAKDDREALYFVGLMAEEGKGCTKDMTLAAENYKRAAEQGNAKAILALAKLYETGEGVAKNPEEAAKLYQSLADRGNGYAQYQLAMLYANGHLGEASEDKAKRLLKAASDNGCEKAAQTLQFMNAKSGEKTSFITPANAGVQNAWNQKS